MAFEKFPLADDHPFIFPALTSLLSFISWLFELGCITGRSNSTYPWLHLYCLFHHQFDDALIYMETYYRNWLM